MTGYLILLTLLILIASAFIYVVKAYVFDIPYVTQVVSSLQFQSITSGSDKTYLVYYYITSSTDCAQGLKYLSPLVSYIQPFSEILMINCEIDTLKMMKPCSIDITGPFPRITALVPPKVRIDTSGNAYTYSEINYTQASLSSDLLYQFLTDNVQDFTVRIDNNNVDDFLDDDAYNKILFFTEYGSTPLFFRVLSNTFLYRLKIGVVTRLQRDVINRFKVPELPYAVIYQTQINSFKFDLPIISYYLEQYDIRMAIENLTPFSWSQKLSVQDLNSIPPINSIISIDSQFILLYYLQNFKTKLSFFIVGAGDWSNDQLFNSLSLETGSAVMFYYINCSKSYSSGVAEVMLGITCLSASTSNQIAYLNPNLVSTSPIDYLTLNAARILNPSLSNLKALIKQVYSSGFTNITDQSQLSPLITNLLNQGITPFIYLYSLQTDNLPFHLLSNIYTNPSSVVFIPIADPTIDTKNLLRSDSLPYLMLSEIDSLSVGAYLLKIYDGEFNFNSISAFVRQKMITKAIVDYELGDYSAFIHTISNNDQLNQHCFSENVKLCVLPLLRHRNQITESTAILNYMKIFQNVATSTALVNQVSYGWLNVTCQVELDSFIKQTSSQDPSIIFLLPASRKYGLLFEAFTSDSIVNYMQKVVNFQVPLFNFNSNTIKLKDAINCLKKDQTLINDVASNPLIENSAVKQLLSDMNKYMLEKLGTSFYFTSKYSLIK